MKLFLPLSRGSAVEFEILDGGKLHFIVLLGTKYLVLNAVLYDRFDL